MAPDFVNNFNSNTRNELSKIQHPSSILKKTIWRITQFSPKSVFLAPSQDTRASRGSSPPTLRRLWTRGRRTMKCLRKTFLFWMTPMSILWAERDKLTVKIYLSRYLSTISKFSSNQERAKIWFRNQQLGTLWINKLLLLKTLKIVYIKSRIRN